MRREKSFWADESGPAAVEYGIMLALIILVSVGAIGAFGTSLWNVFVAIRDAVEPV